MRRPKRWALLLAGCVLAMVVAGRILLVDEAGPDLVARASADPEQCAPLHAPAPPLGTAPAPVVTEPGGIDPLGASHAIRLALNDCP